MISKQKVIEVLKHHNSWRRGAEVEMLKPEDIGDAIDAAIVYLESTSLPDVDTVCDGRDGKK